MPIIEPSESNGRLNSGREGRKAVWLPKAEMIIKLDTDTESEGAGIAIGAGSIVFADGRGDDSTAVKSPRGDCQPAFCEN